ncbi:hypothetical protein GGR19_000328 [Croceicoccus naphthovorans]|nr:hypothetical protein [Croceicoccus naphthovorans]
MDFIHRQKLAPGAEGVSQQIEQWLVGSGLIRPQEIEP